MKYSNEQLILLNEKLTYKLVDLLNHFNVTEFQETKSGISLTCPLHEDADNPKALFINTTKGYWSCFTHNCHSAFQKTIIGLTRGLLSRQNGWGDIRDTEKVVSFPKTIQFIENFLNEKVQKIELSVEEMEASAYNKCINACTLKAPKVQKIPREIVLNSLQIPSKYFLEKRNYTREILVKHDVGECHTKGKKMNGRAVFPVYDLDGMMVGATGRSIYDKCKLCQCYHNPLHLCPTLEFRPSFSKWKHSDDFPKDFFLYNLNNAAPYIQETNTAIVVESPGNVLRLEEAGIFNSVAVFGVSMSPYHKLLLDKNGALNLVVLMDRDSAGDSGKAKILELCGNSYNICFLTPKENDVGEMTVEEIRKLLKGHI